MKQKIFLGILLLLVMGISGCSFNRNRPRATEQPNEGVTYEKGVDFVGVVRAIDTDLATIEFYNASFDKIESYPYSGATALLTKNENQLAISEIEPGEVFDVYKRRWQKGCDAEGDVGGISDRRYNSASESGKELSDDSGYELFLYGAASGVFERKTDTANGDYRRG